MGLDTVLRWCDHNFILILPLLFVGIKTVARGIIHNLLEDRLDTYNTLSWFAVDLCIINIALCVSLKIHDKIMTMYGVKYWAIASWYVLLVVALFLCVGFYIFLARDRAATTNPGSSEIPKTDKHPSRYWRAVKTTASVSASWLVGGFFYSKIIGFALQ